MKRKNNGGFTMIEVLVAIVILAGIVVPVCSSLLLSLRMNAKAEQVLQARLAVSSAVETLMAEGITEASDSYREDDFAGIQIITSVPEASEEEETTEEEIGEPLFYKVIVSDTNDLITVETFIRAAEEEAE